MYVEVKPTDAGFHTEGCLPWVQVDGPFDRKFPINAAAQFPGDGEFRIGVEVPAGTYSASIQNGCFWIRESNFADENFGPGGGGITDGLNSGIVTIAPTDVGFRSEGCGTWTKIG